jgi:N-acetyltransferase
LDNEFFQKVEETVMKQTTLFPKKPVEAQRKIKKIENVPGIKKKRKEKKQLYLDCGQKDLKTIFCSNCGMVYMNKLQEDVQVHEKYCKNEKLISFNGWKNERNVKRIKEDKIVEIRSNDSKIHLKKVEELVDLVNEQLGYSGKSSKFDKIYIYVDGKSKKVVGCLFAERIELANKLKENDEYSLEEQEKVLLGVSRIWVHKNFRRKGIAKELLDACCYYFIDGYPVSKNEIAFSQTTNDGKLFAQFYCEKEEILIYK